MIGFIFILPRKLNYHIKNDILNFLFSGHAICAKSSCFRFTWYNLCLCFNIVYASNKNRKRWSNAWCYMSYLSYLSYLPWEGHRDLCCFVKWYLGKRCPRCNLQPATCNLQPATCNLQPATCNLQPATTNVRLV